MDLARTPFFYNMDGRPTYRNTLPTGVTPLVPVPSDPGIAMGRGYDVSADAVERPEPGRGEQTRLAFVANDVHYEPLWATREAAAAFGMTLVEQGQGVRIVSPVQQLAQIDFEYGMFAGHRSPYLETGYRLLDRVCTDLECHDFPHVFASVDPRLPLVISVARYWPQRGRIRVADLWLPCGHALYVPPRPLTPGKHCVDLHGNRNAALACWQGMAQSSVQTRTLLQVEGGYFHWFWNELPSIHPLMT